MDELAARRKKISTACWVAVAILCASIEPIVVKVGYNNAISPWQLLLTRSIIGALLIFPMTRAWRRVSKNELWELILLSVLLLTTNSLTLLALSELSAVSLITVLTITPAFVAILNQMIGREQLSPKFWVGFFCCFAGVLLGLDYGDAHYTLVGLLPAIGAVLSSSTYRVKSESLMKTVEPALLSTYVFWINGAMVALCLTPFVGNLNVQAWTFGAWMGLTAAAANVAFLLVLSFVGSTRVSILNMLQRPLIVVVAALVLHEQLTLSKIAGLILAVIGIQLATVTRRAIVAAETQSVPATLVERI